MEDNKRRNYGRNIWCSQGGMNQKRCNYSGKISRAQIDHRKSKRNLSSGSKLVESPLNPSLLPTNAVSSDSNNASTLNNKGESSNIKNGLLIAGIVIGSLIILTVIYFLIRFIKKRKLSKDEEQQQEEKLSNPRELTLNIVEHNHTTPELCTTPDTKPILDYYSSKAGLTSGLSSINNSNILNGSDNNNNNHESIPVESKSSEENTKNEYVPQYYNGMEIPPLGARIIPLERQAQIAKELTSANLSPTNKRKSNRRSISSILSINSRRKSNTSINNNNNNSSTTNTLTLIRETPRNEGNENTANIVP